MHHFFEAITNTSGESLIGYFGRVVNPTTQMVVTIASDDAGTPISVVSGVNNAAKTDPFGNIDFYVAPGTYHLDIYAPDATTLLYRVQNVAMNSSKGDKGDTGDPGATGLAANTFPSVAALKAADVSQFKSANLVGAAGVPDGPFTWVLGNFTGKADDQSIIKADSTPLTQGAWVRQGGEGIRLSQGGSVGDAIKFVTPQTFGAVGDGYLGDGATDDTAAFQAALDSGLPVRIPVGEYLITDKLLIDPGANIRGEGGTANYDTSPVKLRFRPATKRDLFNWRNPRTDAPYEFGGCQISGFCVRGFGPGIDACLDLPLLYNGKIDFFAYTGFDIWVRTRRWQDCRIAGGAQGMRVAGVHFAKAGSSDLPSDVTTTLQINAYLAQGPIAYWATERAVTDVKIEGVIESVDNACVMARGNKLSYDGFTENVPRTDAGAAWVFGKTGDAPDYETILTVNLRAGFGVTGVPNIQNAVAFDVDRIGMLKVSGSIYLYRSLLKTTTNTKRVILSGLESASINLFSADGGVADYAVITMVGFKPEFMKLTPSSSDLFDGSNVSRTLRLWSQEELGMASDELFLNANPGNKLTYKDRYGNLTAPIGALRVSGTSGWTINGGRLSPGELVQNANVTLGEPGVWVSTRHTKDEGILYVGCTTIAGSRVITHPTIGKFFKCEIGDYVTVSDGYGDAVTQRRVIDRAPDLTSITLDSVAISTVVASVVVATEAHKLLPLAQQGHREVGVNPTGMLTPNFRGEEVFRTDTFNWYKATGFTNGDWKLIT